ncbi:hypothetical protein Tco_0062289 [Tanacetum coccineum]
MKEHLWYEIRDGKSISVWYNKWHSVEPLSQVLSKRDVYDARMADDCTMAEAMEQVVWKWPKGLLTQDRILKWRPYEELKCALYGQNNDSHEHLFFMGAYNNIWRIVRRLVCGASVCLVWQERNNRIFEGKKIDVKELCNGITETVQMKLMCLQV